MEMSFFCTVLFMPLHTLRSCKTMFPQHKKKKNQYIYTFFFFTYIHKHNLKAICMRSIILKPLTMQTIERGVLTIYKAGTT